MDATVYCEGPDCNTHQHMAGRTFDVGRLPVSWIKAQEFTENGESNDLGFCSWDCVLKFAGRIEPSEEIPADGNL